MSAKQILNDAYDHVSEYSEMLQNPSALVAELLSHKVFSLNEKVQYLNRRLEQIKHANFR